MKIVFIPIKKLKPHERISKKRLEKLKLELIKDGFLKKPIVVENKKFIILDGHHRYYFLKELGLEKIPCLLVDYENIDVLPRRKKYKNVDLKKFVYQTVAQGELLPYKTTKHLLKLKNIAINFSFYEKKQ